MKQLELNHIAPYLPYGLKYQGYYGGVSTMRDIKHIRDYNEETDEYTPNIQVDGYTIEFIKPLLRPLSDLYKEIDGEVGIVEIAREVGLNFIRYDLGSSCVDLYLTDRNGKKSRFWYDGFKTGSFCLTIYGYGKVNQLVGFQYLFENHYDVFGLIDKGLAIDLNSISHE